MSCSQAKKKEVITKELDEALGEPFNTLMATYDIDPVSLENVLDSDVVEFPEDADNPFQLSVDDSAAIHNTLASFTRQNRFKAWWRETFTTEGRRETQKQKTDMLFNKLDSNEIGYRYFLPAWLNNSRNVYFPGSKRKAAVLKMLDTPHAKNNYNFFQNLATFVKKDVHPLKVLKVLLPDYRDGLRRIETPQQFLSWYTALDALPDKTDKHHLMKWLFMQMNDKNFSSKAMEKFINSLKPGHPAASDMVSYLMKRPYGQEFLRNDAGSIAPSLVQQPIERQVSLYRKFISSEFTPSESIFLRPLENVGSLTGYTKAHDTFISSLAQHTQYPEVRTLLLDALEHLIDVSQLEHITEARKTFFSLPALAGFTPDEQQRWITAMGGLELGLHKFIDIENLDTLVDAVDPPLRPTLLKTLYTLFPKSPDFLKEALPHIAKTLDSEEKYLFMFHFFDKYLNEPAWLAPDTLKQLMAPLVDIVADIETPEHRTHMLKLVAALPDDIRGQFIRVATFKQKTLLLRDYNAALLNNGNLLNAFNMFQKTLGQFVNEQATLPGTTDTPLLDAGVVEDKGSK